jgi:U3 small nucleolar RNA-associated protein 14
VKDSALPAQRERTHPRKRRNQKTTPSRSLKEKLMTIFHGEFEFVVED